MIVVLIFIFFFSLNSKQSCVYFEQNLNSYYKTHHISDTLRWYEKNIHLKCSNRFSKEIISQSQESIIVYKTLSLYALRKEKFKLSREIAKKGVQIYSLLNKNQIKKFSPELKNAIADMKKLAEGQY